uniref:Uncharacterized protein n=1 Tax=Candidatus Kentrum sp. LFY TaxID=2126342 RepID=A0A450UQ33_9GAMM|nr:MAG: hypothetical protein BECKLFY1418B_GA0070995_106015 [Candidatus Kentron sp. LFY]
MWALRRRISRFAVSVWNQSISGTRPFDIVLSNTEMRLNVEALRLHGEDRNCNVGDRIGFRVRLRYRKFFQGAAGGPGILMPGHVGLRRNFASFFGRQLKDLFLYRDIGVPVQKQSKSLAKHKKETILWNKKVN